MIRRKLKSEEGASLMLALLFFVICAMVGSVVLAAATTASGRVNRVLREEDQEKYYLESTASLLKASFLDHAYQMPLDEISESDPNPITYVGTTEKPLSANAAIQKQIGKACETLRTNRESKPGFGEATWEVTNSLSFEETQILYFTFNAGATDEAKVTAQVNLKKDYSLEFVITKNGESNELPRLVVSLPADLNEWIDYAEDGKETKCTRAEWSSTNVVQVMNVRDQT